MDQKTWLWRKRSSEKTIIANGKGGFDLKGKVEEVFFPTEKEVALEESVKILNEKLDSLTSECNAKEELLKVREEQAQEVASDKEKAEKEILILKVQLDEALQQNTDANDRLGNLNAALKDCMQQLSDVRDEKERSIARKSSETSKKLTSLAAENSQLQKALQMKEKLIAELSDQRSQAEAEFSALMTRLDSVEKENAFLRYEFRMFEKDIDVRNQEIDFARRSADASEKNYLQSMNKVKKLEAECQRLRVLVRKRVPAPVHFANIKAEVEMQERFQMDSRRKKMVSVTGRESLDLSGKRISFLVERLQEVEQENRLLRDLIRKKDDDCTEIVISNHKENETRSSRSCDSSLTPGLEKSKDCEVSKTSEQKMLGIADMSLMDDFVEMEKLAIVAVDDPHKNACNSNEKLAIVAVDDPHTNACNSNDSSSMRSREWPQEMVKMMVDQVRESGKSIDELLVEIKAAFQVGSSTHSGSQLPPVSGYITWKSPVSSPSVGSSKGVLDVFSSLEDTNHCENGLGNTTDSEQKLRVELETLRESKRMAEEEFENQKMINEELDTQLSMEKARLHKVSKKLSSLEVEMEDKIQLCEELEGTCLEYKLQLESIDREDIAKDDTNKDQNLFQTGWDTKASTVKLAEYEATLLNLGNELKATKQPNEASSYVSKALSKSSQNSNKLKHHFTLLDRILSEDHPKPESSARTPSNPGALVVFPGKKRAKGVGLLGKLLIWRKRSGSKKAPFSFAA